MVPSRFSISILISVYRLSIYIYRCSQPCCVGLLAMAPPIQLDNLKSPQKAALQLRTAVLHENRAVYALRVLLQHVDLHPSGIALSRRHRKVAMHCSCISQHLAWHVCEPPVSFRRIAESGHILFPPLRRNLTHFISLQEDLSRSRGDSPWWTDGFLGWDKRCCGDRAGRVSFGMRGRWRYAKAKAPVLHQIIRI